MQVLPRSTESIGLNDRRRWIMLVPSSCRGLCPTAKKQYDTTLSIWSEIGILSAGIKKPSKYFYALDQDTYTSTMIFKGHTMHPCSSRGCILPAVKHESLKKISFCLHFPMLVCLVVWRKLQFHYTLNFDSQFFCSPISCKNAQCIF